MKNCNNYQKQPYKFAQFSETFASLRHISKSIISFLENHACGSGIFLVLAMFSFLPLFYTPFWQACDDPFIAMLIKGYGISASSSNINTYTLVPWASLIQIVPDFFDISGYVWALYLLSFLSLIAIWMGLCAQPGYIMLKLLLLANMTMYVFLNPQYTVTAFYCAFAGFLLLCAQGARIGKLQLLLACCLLFFGFLIRFKAFFSVMLLGWPFLPLKALWYKKALRYGTLALIFAIVLAFSIDHILKSGPEWDKIEEWRITREDIADANTGNLLAMHPEIMKRHKTSQNDIILGQFQFGGDQELLNSKKYASMKNEIKFEEFINYRFSMAGDAIKYAFHWPLLPFIILIIILLIGIFNIQNISMFCMLILSFFLMGFFSRGGENVLRVYYPLIFFSICFILSTPYSVNKFKKYLYIHPVIIKAFAIFTLLASLLGFSRQNLIEQWKQSHYDLDASRSYINRTVTLGWPKGIEYMFGPFTPMSKLRDMEFQTFLWPILDPHTIKYFNPLEKGSFQEFMEKGHSFLIMRDDQLDSFKIYCAEHMDGELSSKLISPDNVFPVYDVQCVRQTHR